MATSVYVPFLVFFVACASIGWIAEAFNMLQFEWFIDVGNITSIDSGLNFIYNVHPNRTADQASVIFFEYECDELAPVGAFVPSLKINNGIVDLNVTFDSSIVLGKNNFHETTENADTSTLRFCVKFILFTQDGSGANFLETSIEVVYEMGTSITLGPGVKAVSREQDLFETKVDGLSSYYCDRFGVPITGQVSCHQGQSIMVCVEVSNSDFVVSKVTDFTWLYSDGDLSQVALDAEGNPDVLTRSDCGVVSSKCFFETLLKSDFFMSAGRVSGVGVVTLAWKDDDISSNAPNASPVSQSNIPSNDPTVSHSQIPTVSTSNAPSIHTSEIPSYSSSNPSLIASLSPTKNPIVFLSNPPSEYLTDLPTDVSSQNPSVDPSFVPSPNPTVELTQYPSVAPSIAPVILPIGCNILCYHIATPMCTKEECLSCNECASPISQAPSMLASVRPGVITKLPSSKPSQTVSRYPSPSNIPSVAATQECHHLCYKIDVPMCQKVYCFGCDECAPTTSPAPSPFISLNPSFVSQAPSQVPTNKPSNICHSVCVFLVGQCEFPDYCGGCPDCTIMRRVLTTSVKNRQFAKEDNVVNLSTPPFITIPMESGNGSTMAASTKSDTYNFNTHPLTVLHCLLATLVSFF